jgi:cation diffusion facilitator CzcD-associated flavoprotein CzcO
MLYELKKLGMSACGIEAGSDVGGAWYWNRYPGARCDVESLMYCYSFSPELDQKWRWSERYPVQEEIQRYIRFAADQFGVRAQIRFNSFVESAHYDEDRNLWRVKARDCAEEIVGRYLIMATGPLTTVVWPKIAGLEDFKGECYHTARWPRSASLAGKRIGVIGNGSSGTQFMTEAAKHARELHCFIRTPQFTVPALNRPLTEIDYERWNEQKEQIRKELHQGVVNGSGDTFADRDILFSAGNGADYSPEEQARRLEIYWNFGGAQLMRTFKDIMFDEATNAVVGDFVRDKIRAIVKAPHKLETLMPTYHFGGKRIIIDTGFHEIFNQDNVHPHDIRANPILRITEKGVETGQGLIELDMLVIATGFDAAAGTLDRIDIRGRNDLRLRDHWKDGVTSYLGITVSQFPNFLMINGPGAPGPFSNVVISNEWCVEAVVHLLEHMRAKDLTSVEASPRVEREWMALVEAMAAPTFFAKTENWYTGSNVEGKRRGIVNFVNLVLYRQKLAEEIGSHFAAMQFEAKRKVA